MTDDRFELIERLGSGGMATVWRARDARLHREIALKRPLPHLASDPDAVARFEREARAAAALNHPNIVTVYDAGEDDEGPWLSMELVHGISVRRMLDQRGPLPPDQVADYVRQAGSGLDAAHERGLIHRDIKPENLLVGDDGRVRLTDFGLARPISPQTPITEEGAVVGSARYLAPEALDGNQGPSADVYSLAAVAYEMLTGRPPHDAPTLTALLERIRTESPVPPSGLRAVSRQHDTVFAAALSKLSSERPQSAGAFAASLAAASGATLPMDPLPAVPPPTPSAAPAGPAETTLVVAATPSAPGPRLPGALKATLVAVGTGAALLIAIALAAGAGRDPGTAAADTTLAVTTTLAPTTTTTATTTTAAATTTTTTAAPTTTPQSVEAIIVTLVAQLSDALDAASPGAMKPKEARDIGKDANEAAAAFLDGDVEKAQEKLEDAAETVEEKVDSRIVRSALLELLEAIASAMGFELPS